METMKIFFSYHWLQTSNVKLLKGLSQCSVCHLEINLGDHATNCSVLRLWNIEKLNRPIESDVFW